MKIKLIVLGIIIALILIIILSVCHGFKCWTWCSRSCCLHGHCLLLRTENILLYYITVWYIDDILLLPSLLVSLSLSLPHPPTPCMPLRVSHVLCVMYVCYIFELKFTCNFGMCMHSSGLWTLPLSLRVRILEREWLNLLCWVCYKPQNTAPTSIISMSNTAIIKHQRQRNWTRK